MLFCVELIASSFVDLISKQASDCRFKSVLVLLLKPYWGSDHILIFHFVPYVIHQGFDKACDMLQMLCEIATSQENYMDRMIRSHWKIKYI